VTTGQFTLVNFKDFFSTALFRESFWNSLYVGVMTVLLASIFSMPLAYFTSRFEFKGAVIVQSLGIIPLIMPPFVGAVSMMMLFGRNGSVNLLLEQWFGINIPFMEGLNGVIFVESLHYFPFILINLSAALQNIDKSMEESAQNLGCSGFRLFRRIVLPLSMPGYMAGASLVFLKVFDDLGTPLLLNVNNMLAPQAYLRIASIGIKDPMGYVISVILVVISLSSMWMADIRHSCCDLPVIHVDGHEVAKGKGLRHRAKGRRRSGQTPHAAVGEGYGLVHHPFNYDPGIGAPFWPYTALFWNYLVIQHLARCFQL
jgi:iron(III) transport system permease protein